MFARAGPARWAVRRALPSSRAALSRTFRAAGPWEKVGPPRRGGAARLSTSQMLTGCVIAGCPFPRKARCPAAASNTGQYHSLEPGHQAHAPRHVRRGDATHAAVGPRLRSIVSTAPADSRRCFAAAAQTAEIGRIRNGGFGVSNGDKQTFVRGHCQSQPATHSGPSARPNCLRGRRGTMFPVHGPDAVIAPRSQPTIRRRAYA